MARYYVNLTVVIDELTPRDALVSGYDAIVKRTQLIDVEVVEIAPAYARIPFAIPSVETVRTTAKQIS